MTYQYDTLPAKLNETKIRFHQEQELKERINQLEQEVANQKQEELLTSITPQKRSISFKHRLTPEQINASDSLHTSVFSNDFAGRQTSGLSRFDSVLFQNQLGNDQALSFKKSPYRRKMTTLQRVSDISPARIPILNKNSSTPAFRERQATLIDKLGSESRSKIIEQTRQTQGNNRLLSQKTEVKLPAIGEEEDLDRLAQSPLSIKSSKLLNAITEQRKTRDSEWFQMDPTRRKSSNSIISKYPKALPHLCASLLTLRIFRA